MAEGPLGGGWAALNLSFLICKLGAAQVPSSLRTAGSVSCPLSPKGASFLHRRAGWLGSLGSAEQRWRRPPARPTGMCVTSFLGHAVPTFPVSRLCLVKRLLTHPKASAGGLHGPAAENGVRDPLPDQGRPARAQPSLRSFQSPSPRDREGAGGRPGSRARGRGRVPSGGTGRGEQ